uniref:DNA-directed RNA polymerase subunit beta n=3 Tax=Pyrrosia TaxID=156491 RepID=A0A3G6IP19_9MONI|nr:RNA polymerase beta subunit [Pyrrosia bonii]YP_009774191.1 RNA polymerase subunit beta [Pyrrosia subfurfuracea]AZA06599.1 RNA polymerase beta subunit [Pyrrosia bonii]QIZ74804.1 RNA polymerase subunit beta [Pyrrosia subfurfuracea]QJQ36942.1 RNA polymerase beta subunit [Pyrrosia drakeana]
MPVLPELAQIQFEGFNRFIHERLLEELENFPKIEDTDKEVEFRVISRQYQLAQPSVEERDVAYQCVTYSSDPYVPVQLIRSGDRVVQEEDVRPGSIPWMNSKGTFTINGVARVLVSQILRSPGIYYNRESDQKGISAYTSTVISDRGGRFKLEIDRREKIWIRISKKKKISISILLIAMGLSKVDILQNARYPKIFSNILKKQEGAIESSEDATAELYKNSYSATDTDISFSESIFKELQKRFSQHRFELGRIGRRNLNIKLTLDVPEEEYFLLPQDILAAADHSIEISYGMGNLDDIDHLKNRRVRSVADLLQEQLKLALTRLENLIRQNLSRAVRRKRAVNPRGLVTPTPVVATFKEFFGSHPLSQFLDQINPLSELVHKRKLSSVGPGGLTRRTASFQARDIHFSHYGRICPIETSEGMNAGLISSLAIQAEVSNSGSSQSPYLKISGSSEKEQLIYSSPTEDDCCRIATENSLISQWRAREKELILVRYQQEFLSVLWEQVDFRSIHPLHYFSIGASIIPFIEHNDANRALTGSTMQRQAVPLVNSERCFVGTGLESQVASDSGSVVVSEREGQIRYIDGNLIELLSIDEIPGNVVVLRVTTNRLKIYERSNSNTCIHQNSTALVGELPRRGEVISDGAATARGESALGKNILVAYMPWEGYNFEDAVLISERLIYEDISTSFHIERHEVEVCTTNQGPERVTKQIPQLDSHTLRHLDENGIVESGSWVEAGDALVGKLTPQEGTDSSRAPEGRLLQAISGIQLINARESCLKVPIGGRGRVIDIRWVYPEDDTSNDLEVIHIYILQKRKIQVGDKIAGRHGNKGIVSKILPRQDMPYLQDGTPVDMILSPLGVPSRMNVGQIFECLLGLAGEFSETHYRIVPFDERYEREASRKLVLAELCRASAITHNPWLFEPDHPGKSRLIDGRTGESFVQPITIGKGYMMKLIHQVDDKIHSRSSGPYALVTQQPLKGRSRRGGQRVGEMEVWALEGFGVSYTSQEMLTIKSDHIQARYKVLSAIMTGKPVSRPNTVPESFRLLVRELRRMGLNLEYNFIIEEGLGRGSETI